MKHTEIQICLISGQPMPNVLPAIDTKMRADRVIQIISIDMKKRAEWQSRVLKKNRIKVTNYSIDNPWSVKSIEQVVNRIISEEQDAISDGRICLNATGGTKMMSIVAYNLCQKNNIPVFYIHPERNKIIWMVGGENDDFELEEKIKIEDCLAIHGVDIEGEINRTIENNTSVDVGLKIIDKIGYFNGPVGIVNALAASAEKNKDRISGQITKEFKALNKLIQLFEKNGFLKRKGDRLQFPNEESRFCVNGGWFEYVVFDAVKSLQKSDPEIQDVAFNVNIVRQQKGKPVRNEIDIMFLRKNRLYIIECKTRKFDGDGEDSPAAEAIYKLDTLVELTGGLQARAMLVSYKDMGKFDKLRARDLRIQLCVGNDVYNIKKHLKQLMRAW